MMTSSDVAREFFDLLEQQAWDSAATRLSSEFIETYRPHALHQVGGIRSRYVSEASLEIPTADRPLFALSLRLMDRRAMAEREVAQAQYEQPEEAWRVVGEVVAPNRIVIGEVPEGEARSIVVYRVHGPEGHAKALPFVREEGTWLVNSDEFAREGYVGLTSLAEDPGLPNQRLLLSQNAWTPRIPRLAARSRM